MMNTEPTIKTVTILPVGVDDRQVSMLRMAFKMHSSIRYVLITKEEGKAPDLVLVEGDGSDSKNDWQSERAGYPEAVTVLFASREPDFIAPYLRKPIEFSTLFANLRHLLQGNSVWVPGEQRRGEQKTETIQDSTHGASGVIPEVPGKAVSAGNHAQEQVAIGRFSAYGTLLGKVTELAKASEDTAVLVDGKPMLIVFPEIRKVLLAVDSDTLRAVCLKNPADLTVQTKPVHAAALREKAKLDLTACIWQLAAWTAQGRLMDPLTPSTLLKLKSWPNMTRLAFLPEGIRLSAFLIKTQVPLTLLYKLLPVDIEDILNYLAVVYATGYLETEQPIEAGRVSSSTVRSPEALVSPLSVQPAEEAEPVVLQRAAVHRETDGGEGKSDNRSTGSGSLLSRLMGKLRSK